MFAADGPMYLHTKTVVRISRVIGQARLDYARLLRPVKISMKIKISVPPGGLNEVTEESHALPSPFQMFYSLAAQTTTGYCSFSL